MDQSSTSWRPSRASVAVLTVLGLDRRDYKDRSEVSWPYFLIGSALSTGLLASITFAVASGIIWDGISWSGRIAAGVVGLSFITLLDLWAVSWQPDPSRKSAAIHTGKELPTEIVPPMPPWKNKALALVPRLIVATILALTIGTFLAIAMNQEAVQQEKTQLLLENEQSLVDNADAPRDARIESLQGALDKANRDYAAAAAAEQDANNRVKCEAGQFGEPTYNGVDCNNPGGDGLQQAQAIREQARRVLDNATAAVNQAQSALESAQSEPVRSEADDVAGAATSQGLENTIKAWWNLVSKETSPIALVLLFIPHILAITLDLTPVLLKLLRGYQPSEARRWRRLHIDSWYERQAVLNAAAPLQAPWLMTMETMRDVRRNFWGEPAKPGEEFTPFDEPAPQSSPDVRDEASEVALVEPEPQPEPEAWAAPEPDDAAVDEPQPEPAMSGRPRRSWREARAERRQPQPARRTRSDDAAWRIELDRTDPYR